MWIFRFVLFIAQEGAIMTMCPNRKLIASRASIPVQHVLYRLKNKFHDAIFVHDKIHFWLVGHTLTVRSCNTLRWFELLLYIIYTILLYLYTMIVQGRSICSCAFAHVWVCVCVLYEYVWVLGACCHHTIYTSSSVARCLCSICYQNHRKKKSAAVTITCRHALRSHRWRQIQRTRLDNIHHIAVISIPSGLILLYMEYSWQTEIAIANDA